MYDKIMIEVYQKSGWSGEMGVRLRRADHEGF